MQFVIIKANLKIFYFSVRRSDSRLNCTICFMRSVSLSISDNLNRVCSQLCHVARNQRMRSARTHAGGGRNY